MASSLLLLLDDIAAIMDDVAVLTKVAAKKTAGVLGDDLALNAEQVSGVSAERELAVVWAVFKGSLINKAILVPLAVALSIFLPWLVLPLLVLGGLYLCFEGVEKLVHHNDHQANATDHVVDEAAKIKGAIRTDFILSAEIIVITLGTVAQQSLLNTFMVLGAISTIMTVGVYGLVALIVKLDDIGLYLVRKDGAGAGFGRGLLRFAPLLMKGLTIVGTAAMFLVGGGIVVEAVPGLHHAIADLAAATPALFSWLLPSLINAVVGLLAGGLCFALFFVATRLRAA